MTKEQIDNVFTYHRPVGDQPQRYEKIRDAARQFAYLLKDSIPASREASLAFTNLQQCVMFANAAIAINEKEPVNGQEHE